LVVAPTTITPMIPVGFRPTMAGNMFAATIHTDTKNKTE
jgi:hypothetical protein